MWGETDVRGAGGRARLEGPSRFEVLNEDDSILVLVDEAHRTQERELGGKGERVGHGGHGKETHYRGKRDLGQGEEHGGQCERVGHRGTPPTSPPPRTLPVAVEVRDGASDTKNPEPECMRERARGKE